MAFAAAATKLKPRSHVPVWLRKWALNARNLGMDAQRKPSLLFRVPSWTSKPWLLQQLWRFPTLLLLQQPFSARSKMMTFAATTFSDVGADPLTFLLFRFFFFGSFKWLFDLFPIMLMTLFWTWREMNLSPNCGTRKTLTRTLHWRCLGFADFQPRSLDRLCLPQTKSTSRAIAFRHRNFGVPKQGRGIP